MTFDKTVLIISRGGFTMDSLGRRKTIMIGATINLVGAVLQSAAQNLAMVLVGRILAGWAVGLMSMSVPIYQSECAHPKTRGKHDAYMSEDPDAKSIRSHCRSCAADDWCGFHRVDMGWLWRLQGSRQLTLFVALPTRIPMCSMYGYYLRNSLLPRVATLSC